MEQNKYVALSISIHAPTRGATGCQIYICRCRLYFNPRPHTGSDDFNPYLPFISVNFNPRPHTGSDRMQSKSCDICKISIHAPTRGATMLLYDWKGAVTFQSTPPHGERPKLEADQSPPQSFQSTPPHGERHNDFEDLDGEVKISIHAPTRGATGGESEIKYTGLISIHAPTRGATTSSLRYLPSSGYFNPRPHTGSDRKQ